MKGETRPSPEEREQGKEEKGEVAGSVERERKELRELADLIEKSGAVELFGKLPKPGPGEPPRSLGYVNAGGRGFRQERSGQHLFDAPYRGGGLKKLREWQGEETEYLLAMPLSRTGEKIELIHPSDEELFVVEYWYMHDPDTTVDYRGSYGAMSLVVPESVLQRLREMVDQRSETLEELRATLFPLLAKARIKSNGRLVKCWDVEDLSLVTKKNKFVLAQRVAKGEKK